MTTFNRRGHFRTNAHGTTFWVAEHSVGRDIWLRAALEADGPRREAYSTLKQHGVSSRTSCFIVPNSKCPVCGADVYFYCNSQGSRVYFDELGPPWPKHGCMDRGRSKASTVQGAQHAPRLRPLGQIQEILSAADLVGPSIWPENRDRNGKWKLLALVNVRRQGILNELVMEHVDPRFGKGVVATCYSYEVRFEPGMFIAKRAGIFSFVDSETLQEVEFSNGDTLANRVRKPAADNARTLAQPEISSVAFDRNTHPNVSSEGGFKPRSKKAEGHRRDKRRVQPVVERRALSMRSGKSAENVVDLKRRELKHFAPKKEEFSFFFNKYKDLIRGYVDRGVRAPDTIAQLLNRQGLTTAAGVPWTPRLAHFLVRLVMDPANPPSPRPRNQTKSSTDGLDRNEIAERLSRLGRVSFKEKP